MVNGRAAAQTLLSFRNITPGMCLHYVWQAYKQHGARVDGSWPTAYAGWFASPGKHEGDRNPPAGVPVWFGPRSGSAAGDVVISLGGGRVAATDYPGWGQTGSCTIAERQAQIGRPYLGWTETILGVPIEFGDSPLLPLATDGEWGARTTRALQQSLGVADDGEMGPQTIGALQRALGVPDDGEIGPVTASALQRALGVTADGDIGPQTIRALQEFLNAGRKFQGSPPAAPATPADVLPLDVDGEWGPRTTVALQRALGVGDDGQLGPITIKALQTAIGATVDGAIGPDTTRHLQALVGVDQDGQLGPITIRGLQEHLNARRPFTKTDVQAPAAPVVYPQPSSPTYPGATWWGHSPNSSPRNGTKVDRFVVHHAATTAAPESLRERFMSANDRSVSPSWLVGADGRVEEIVPPDGFRPWTTGQFDLRAVTVETQNTSGDPSWGISDASHEAIAKLVAWAAGRYGFPIDREHVIGHREVPGQATACPGPSMNLDHIVELARGYSKPTPPSPVDDGVIEVPRSKLQEAFDWLKGLLGGRA